MSQPSEYQGVETKGHTLIARSLAVIILSLWLGGRFVARKLAALVARLRNKGKTA